MKNSTLKNIRDILQNSPLSRLVQQANRLNLLNDALQRCLAEPYRGLCRVTQLQDACLTLEVQSAVVRQGLLLQHTALLQQIQQEIPEVMTLQLTVNPRFNPSTRFT